MQTDLLSSMQLSKVLEHGGLEVIALGFGDENLATFVDNDIIDRPAAN